MGNVNNIYERKNCNGSVDYIVNFGTILYNNKLVPLTNLIIPLSSQNIFDLPNEKNYYAAVNVYYSVEYGRFIFDTIKKSNKFINFQDGTALSNVVPVAQFILEQQLSSFKVKKINCYSKMSTFSITDIFNAGDRGFQGPIGYTGLQGDTGQIGETGLNGLIGITGYKGITGVGITGQQGIQGVTGYYPDLDLAAYLKFKTDDTDLTDYSIYEQDFIWGATGAGFTGILWTGSNLTDTCIQFLEVDESNITVEEGIKDNCHSLSYNGGICGYEYSGYIGFTGTIQTWVNFDVRPVTDFTYSIDGLDTNLVYFEDTSLFYPNYLIWEIENDVYTASSFSHRFSSSGEFIVKLTASNRSGSMWKAKKITIS